MKPSSLLATVASLSAGFNPSNFAPKIPTGTPRHLRSKYKPHLGAKQRAKQRLRTGEAHPLDQAMRSFATT